MNQIKQINTNHTRGINTSKKEIIDLGKAWVILSLAFAILLTGLKFNAAFFVAFIISALIVGLGFLLHELAHKFVAQRYGCFAEFRSFDMMLILALVFSFFGYIFAAPGAVMINGHLTTRQRGITSAAGPATNMILSLLFIPLLFTTNGIFLLIATYGFMINAWLGLFNMIPVAMFDGKKIWDWNKIVYGIMAVLAIGLIVFQTLLSTAAN